MTESRPGGGAKGKKPEGPAQVLQMGNYAHLQEKIMMKRIKEARAAGNPAIEADVADFPQPELTVKEKVQAALGAPETVELARKKEQIERFGIVDGARLLQISFRPGSGIPERFAFLRALEPQARELSQVPDLLKRLEFYRTDIIELPESAGPMSEKHARVVISADMDDVPRSVWEGHFAERSDPEAGEERLRDILERLLREQERHIERESEGWLSKLWNWRGRRDE